jgi:diguanylate cyclase (GGDEF)-like protein
MFEVVRHFKDWNDSFGHASGDALLRALAHLLRAEAQGEHDLVARNGGDEFCIVFGESGKADAIERAEALRRRIASTDFSPLRSATDTARCGSARTTSWNGRTRCTTANARDEMPSRTSVSMVLWSGLVRIQTNRRSARSRGPRVRSSCRPN